jgi:hypothetical protein
LKSRLRGFSRGKLLEVKSLSNKYRETKFRVFLQYRRAVGNWLLKGSKKLEDRTISGIRGKLLLLSGLDDPRIPVALALGVSTKACPMLRTHNLP